MAQMGDEMTICVNSDWSHETGKAKAKVVGAEGEDGLDGERNAAATNQC